MARRDISARYVGSVFGMTWSVLQPLVMILVFWFIFSVGFRVVPKNDVPFVVWLTAGLAPWFAFADMLNNATRAITSNANLVKKTLFSSEILPVVSVVSGLFAHVIFLTIILCLLLFLQMDYSFYFLQALYYLFCMCVLAIGFSWIFAAVNVFLADVAHLVAIVLQVGFWATPIFWDISMMPAKIQLILKINPVYYIVQGYRESFIYFVPFWQHPFQTAYFWFFALTIFISGAWVFQKLKPQFPDVL